jgi:NADPH-dependent 7-cyano-7-deazaguanine reductase QueF-like protein
MSYLEIQLHINIIIDYDDKNVIENKKIAINGYNYSSLTDMSILIFLILNDYCSCSYSLGDCLGPSSSAY